MSRKDSLSHRQQGTARVVRAEHACQNSDSSPELGVTRQAGKGPARSQLAETPFAPRLPFLPAHSAEHCYTVSERCASHLASLSMLLDLLDVEARLTTSAIAFNHEELFKRLEHALTTSKRLPLSWPGRFSEVSIHARDIAGLVDVEFIANHAANFGLQAASRLCMQASRAWERERGFYRRFYCPPVQLSLTGGST